MTANTKASKRLCLVIHSLAPGGMERVMSQLLCSFAREGDIEIHLLLYGISRSVFYEIPSTVTVHKPGFEFSDSKRTWHTVKTLFFLRKTVKAIEPDSILSFGEVWNNLVLLALYGLKFPVFISDRSSPERKLGRLHSFLRRWLYPKATGLIVQTQKAREVAELHKRNSRIQVIGNPIRQIEKGDPDLKENIVLTVGRLVKTKNMDQLIKLFVRLDKPGWRLVIVGGDAQKQNILAELTHLIEELGVKDRVILAGSCAAVDEYYRKAKIFAFTSSSEGFPNVVGESMAAGLPVVSFDCVAGPSEMITHGKDGFLVPVFDYQGFGQRLSQLMDDEGLRNRLGERARAGIERFSIDHIGEQFLQFLLPPDCGDQTI